MSLRGAEGNAAIHQGRLDRFATLAMTSVLEIDRNALLLPVPIARGIRTSFFADRSPFIGRALRRRNRRRLAEVSGRIEVLGPFHDANMGGSIVNAKR